MSQGALQTTLDDSLNRNDSIIGGNVDVDDPEHEVLDFGSELSKPLKPQRFLEFARDRIAGRH